MPSQSGANSLQIIRNNFPSHISLPFWLLAVLPVLILTRLFFEGVSSDLKNGSLTILLLIIALPIIIVYRVIDEHSELRGLKELGITYPKASQYIHTILKKQGINCQLLLSKQEHTPYITGLYGDMVISESFAKRIESTSDKTIEAIIIHELSHALTADSRKLSIVSTLPRFLLNAIKWGWIAWIMLLVPLILIYSFSNLSSTDRENFLYISIGFPLTLFVILNCYLLMVTLMRSILKRNCEFLADAMTIDVQQDNSYIKRALIRSSVQRHLTVLHGKSNTRLASNESFSLDEHELKLKFTQKLPSLLKRLEFFFILGHPSFQERLNAFENPWIALDARRSIFVLGNVLIFAFLAVLKFSSPLIMLLTIFVGYFGMAPLIFSESIKANGKLLIVWKVLLKNSLIMFAGIGSGIVWLAISTGLVILLNYTIELIFGIEGLSSSIISSIGALHISYSTLFKPLFTSFGGILFLLFGNSIIIRDVSCWYKSPTFSSYPKEYLFLSTLIFPSFVTVGYLITQVSRTIISSTDPVFTTLSLFPVIPLLPFLLWPPVDFFLRRKHFHKICQECSCFVPGNYYVGKKCDKCDSLLHKWLFDINTGKKRRPTLFRKHPLFAKIPGIYDFLNYYLYDYTVIPEKSRIFTVMFLSAYVFIPCLLISWCSALFWGIGHP